MRKLALLLVACSAPVSVPDGGSGGGHGGNGGGSAGGSGGAGGGGAAATSRARLFFTDLLSGPNTGGQDDKGAFVTVWGKGFGAAQGGATVTIGGGAVAGYPVWTDTKVTVQLGAAAATGAIVMHLGDGDTNGLPFTVRAGNIYFVKGGADDLNAGTYDAPWATIPKAKNALAPGDIAYLEDVDQLIEDNFSAALSMDFNDGANSGTADKPKALVAYPGATPAIGAESGLERGIFTPGISGTFDHWVISQLKLRGAGEALQLEGSALDWRIVGNDISCPNGAGQTGCVETGGASHIAFLGNDVHDCAKNNASITKFYHAVYFSTDSNHVEVGWNQIRDGQTCRALQFHSSPVSADSGHNQFDLSVHDNVIHDTVCDGINFATVDPSQGTVEAYNNVVYAAGKGPDPSDGSSDYACIYIANITNTGVPGSGTVKLYNNTLYDCGVRGTGAGGAISIASGPVMAQVDDNILVGTALQESYFTTQSDPTKVSGSNNLLFGGGGMATTLTGTVSMDPMFVSASTHDFHLQLGSPALNAGIATDAGTDLEGVVRPQGSAFDIGAYEIRSP
jgi:hypothetical protein